MKRLLSIILCFVIVIGLFSGSIVAKETGLRQAMLHTDQVNKALEYMPDEIIVKFTNDNKAFRVIKVPHGKVEEHVEIYKNRKDVVYAEPNYILHAFGDSGELQTFDGVPNDPGLSEQWNFDVPQYGGMNARNAWPLSTGQGVVVAVVDTGVAYADNNMYKQAEDLVGTTFVQGYDFINNDAHAYDDEGHGTHVAGTIAQSTNNSLGVAGVAFDASIMPVKVLNEEGSGALSVIAEGIYWAVNNGADVINLSLGGSGDYENTLLNAVKYAYENGVVVVAATGNDDSVISYPAKYTDYVISVGSIGLGAYGDSLGRAYYSNYGPEIDVVAPGGELYLAADDSIIGYGIVQNTFDVEQYRVKRRIITDYNFGYLKYQGTSMATPHVAGAAALLLAYNETLTPGRVEQLLKDSAYDLGPVGFDVEYGYGLIDVYEALNLTEPNHEEPVNRSPVANAFQTASVSGGELININLDGSDPDGDAITYSIGNGTFSSLYTALGGSVVLVDPVSGQVSYQAPANIDIDVNDSFTYYVSDGEVSSQPATVTIPLKAEVVGEQLVDLVVDVSTSRSGKTMYATGTAAVTVTVDGNPVAGADVAGHWEVNGALLVGGVESTDGSGVAVFEINDVLVTSKKITFVIDSVE